MIRTLVTAALMLIGIAAHAIAGPDDDAIRHLLHATFDRPGAPLTVAPVTVVGDHAVAGWTQDDRGGRALLRRKPAGWTVMLCSGDGIRSAEALRAAGVPEADATALARGIEQAERGVDAARLALLASFEGILMIEDTGAHPVPHHGGHR